MGWISRITESRATKTTGATLSNPSAWLVDLLGGPDSATGIKVTEDNALTANAVWACVRVLAETIAALPLHVYRQQPNGGREKAPDYPLYELLHDQPNPEMSSMEWREAATGHLALWGNSFSEIELDTAFRPIAIWPLRPDKVTVWRNFETRQLEYIYQLQQGGTIYLKPEQVLHIRTLSRDGIVGMSPIGQQREAIGLGLALERYGGGLFGNGANPGGIISVPGVLSKDAKQKMRESWEESHRGPGNAGRTAVLEQGVTWQQTGMPPEDAQFILSRTFSLLEVARIFRVPPHKLQELSRATFSNIEQQSLEFVTDCILPYLVRFEQAARRSLIPERERSQYFVKHAVDALLRGDLASRYAAYTQGRQWGWLSADDVREREDMNPLPDGKGEDYLTPLNMVPAGTEPPDASAPATPTPQPDSSAPDTQAVRVLEAFLEDVGRRLTAREDADICRMARKFLALRQREKLSAWLEGFYEGHRAFVVRQVLPVFRAADPDLADENALEFADRHIRELRTVVEGFEALEDLEVRLARWEAERPPQIAQRELRRVWRLTAAPDAGDQAVATLSRALAQLAEPREAPRVTVENHQPPINVQPAEVRISEGAVKVDVAPPEVTISDGAMRVDVQPSPPAEVTIAEGAVRVDVAPSAPAEVQFAEGAMRVDVAPAEVNIAEGAVRVDVAAPPAEVQIAEGAMRVDVAPAEVNIAEGAVRVDMAAPETTIAEGAVRVDVAPPPPAEVTISEGAVRVDVAPPELAIHEGAVRVDVAAPPATDVTIAEGAVQVEVQAPPPAEVTIADGAVKVDVAAPQAPQVVFKEGAVKVEAPAPVKPPTPRLSRAKAEARAKETKDKTAALRKRKPNPKEKPGG